MNFLTESNLPFRASQRLSAINVSEILKISSLTNEMKRQGRDVIDLSVGEPDFSTPDHIKEAAARAMRNEATKYTALDGTIELKVAIQEKFRRENNISYGLNEVTVSAGAKQILFNALMASLNIGDEVIIPTPAWVSYTDIVAIAGGKSVFVPCREENGFRLAPEDLDRSITSRTRWIVLNSPSNPTGATYSESDYRSVLEVLLRHPHVWLLVDDIYEHIVYDGLRFTTPAAIKPELRDRTLTINGVSKAYAMTGWRIGYAGGPNALIKAMAVVQSQSTSCPSSVSQAAAAAALSAPQDLVRERCQVFQSRRDLVIGELNRIPEFKTRIPEGAFYIFVNCAGVIGRKTPEGTVISSDRALAEYVLFKTGVAVVPGSAFGLKPYLRISYAASTADLREACRRIEVVVATLST